MGKRTDRSSCVGAIDAYSCDPQSTVAARVDQEHEWAAAAVLSEGGPIESALTQAQLNAVAQRLNTRPRETLNWKPQQRYLTPPLRRPVEPASLQWTSADLTRSPRQRKRLA